MKDTVLLNVSSMINAYPMKDDKIAMFTICFHLLRFSCEKELLQKNPFDEQGDLNIDTIIKESDLTDLGKQLFDDLAEKWFVYTDKTDGKIDRKNNVKMLEKYFNKYCSHGQNINLKKFVRFIYENIE